MAEEQRWATAHETCLVSGPEAPASTPAEDEVTEDAFYTALSI